MTWIVEFAATIVLKMILFTAFSLLLDTTVTALRASFLFADASWVEQWSDCVWLCGVWVWIFSLIFIQSLMQTVGRLPCLSSPRGECNPWLDAVVEFERVGPSY